MSRICVVTTVHPPTDTRIYHKEIAALREGGHAVSMIARGDCDARPAGVSFHPIEVPKRRAIRVLVAPWRALREALRHRADIYHLHDPELLGVGVLLRVLTRARVVYDVHENVVAQIRTKHWIPAMLRRPIGLVYALAERVCLRFVHAVLLAEDSYAPLYRWHRNVRVLHNYPLSGTRQPQARRTDRPRLIYVGGMTRPRGAMTMLRAAALLRDRGVDVSWTLIGQASPALASEMKAYLSEHGLDRTVDLVGGLPFPEAQAAVAEADIGLSVLDALPNYVESMPTKLLEYLAAGLPVIASDFPLWRSLLEEFESGLTVPPADPEALADAVASMIADPERFQAMSENGRARLVASRMTWESEARVLNDLYERMTSR